MEDIFKSPIKKLNKFFIKSRDKWKERAKKAIQETRGQKKRIQFLETSKKSLKDEIRELKEKNRELIIALENNKKKQ